MTAELQGRPVTPVSILAAELGGLYRELAARDGADPGLTARLRAAYELAAGLDPYLSGATTPESPALARLAHRTRAEDWTRHGEAGALEPEMLSGHVEGQLLKMLVHATRARRVLEIGMFTGYSALAMAEALPPDGTVVACEIHPDAADLARRAFAESPAGDRVDVRVGPASATLASLAEQGATFDLVFVDADKAGYAGYVATLLDTGMLPAHGLLCVDNTLMQGQPWVDGEPTANGVAITAFNRAVADDPRVEQVLVPLRDGVTLIRRVS
jgi:caffeoyl-CoA O-methyltransferase